MSKKYVIIGRDYKIEKNGVNKELDGAICDIICNTLDDLPTAEDIARENILAGSWIWIINEADYRVLNLDGEWK